MSSLAKGSALQPRRGKINFESRMAGRAAVPHIPAMCPRDAAHDGEAEPRAASRTVDELAEGAFFERSGKAGAFIGNIDRHAIIGGSRALSTSVSTACRMRAASARTDPACRSSYSEKPAGSRIERSMGAISSNSTVRSTSCKVNSSRPLSARLTLRKSSTSRASASTCSSNPRSAPR
jgi:hypothetical protein